MMGDDNRASGIRRLSRNGTAPHLGWRHPAATTTKELTMKYMLLIYSEPQTPPEGEPQDFEAMMQPWFDYGDAMTEAGVHVAGDALEAIETATTVRVRNDETVLTDGPFAETKEVLGGYYLIDVDNVDDAIAWAARCPAAQYGSMEVRPLMVIPEA